jgi:serine/threonine protein kinase
LNELLHAALEAIGGPEDCRQIPNLRGLDRGTCTYRAGGWKLKTMSAPALRLHHETAVYQTRERQGLHRGSRHGYHEAGLWLAVPWVPGPTLWEVFAPARHPRGSGISRALRDPLLQVALDSCAELQRWHRDEWLHGDVQPSNVILSDRAAYIDFEHARHPQLPLPYPYRGGLAETTAPEVARQLVDEHEPPTHLSPEAEIYALGATIRWAWTGHAPTGQRGYGDIGPTKLLHDIAHGRQRNLREDRPYSFPELEELIEGAIRVKPHRRCLP